MDGTSKGAISEDLVCPVRVMARFLPALEAMAGASRHPHPAGASQTAEALETALEVTKLDRLAMTPFQLFA